MCSHEDAGIAKYSFAIIEVTAINKFPYGLYPRIKKQMRRCCYILFLLVLLSACSDNGEVVALLDHAEAVMEEHPDSAYQFLCEADSCVADQSRKTRMRHQMLMTEAKNKLFLPLPSDTLFQEVKLKE